MTTFPTPTPLEWREQAEKALKGRAIESLLHLDADGLAIRPLYADATGVQALRAPRRAGSRRKKRSTSAMLSARTSASLTGVASHRPRAPKRALIT